jgi:hypothetical protein
MCKGFPIATKKMFFWDLFFQILQRHVELFLLGLPERGFFQSADAVTTSRTLSLTVQSVNRTARDWVHDRESFLLL